MAVAVTSSPSALEIGKPVRLFQTRIVRAGAADVPPQYDVASDSRFLMNVSSGQDATSSITVLSNWKPRSTR